MVLKARILFGLIALASLTACTDDTTSTYSQRERVFCLLDVTKSDVLFNVIGNSGSFATVRERVVDGTTQIEIISNSGVKGYYPYDRLSNNFYFGLGGLIMGTSTQVDSDGDGNFINVCYDLACPICDRVDRRLTLTVDGYAKCAKCGVTYNMNNNGAIDHVPEGAEITSPRGLYQYRLDYDGQTIYAHN